MATSPVTVALYPNAFGMGYVICESPKELINYGMARIRPLTNDRYTKRLLRFIKHYRPVLIILRGYEDGDNRISKRTVRAIKALEREAKEQGLEVHKYSREDIQEVFKQFGHATKYGISKTICSWYPELKPRMPDLRKNTMAEHYQMGVFDAFALMLTHFYLDD